MYYFPRISWRHRAIRGTNWGLPYTCPRNTSCLSLSFLFSSSSASILFPLRLFCFPHPSSQSLLLSLVSRALVSFISWALSPWCFVSGSKVEMSEWQRLHLPVVSLCHFRHFASSASSAPGRRWGWSWCTSRLRYAFWNAQWELCPVSLFKWVVATGYLVLFSGYTINKYLLKI